MIPKGGWGDGLGNNYALPRCLVNAPNRLPAARFPDFRGREKLIYTACQTPVVGLGWEIRTILMLPRALEARGKASHGWFLPFPSCGKVIRFAPQVCDFGSPKARLLGGNGNFQTAALYAFGSPKAGRLWGNGNFQTAAFYVFGSTKARGLWGNGNFQNGAFYAFYEEGPHNKPPNAHNTQHTQQTPQRKAKGGRRSAISGGMASFWGGYTMTQFQWIAE